MTRQSGRVILPVFILFLLSGATSLAYQVVWTRELIRVFGATSLAISTVLAAFMAGLALGSYAFGKYIDRRGNPLIAYGILELGIGIFALVFPFVLAGLNPLYSALYPDSGETFAALSVFRFLLSFLILLIPTTLMGGTLPILSRYVTESLSGLALRVGWLYSINTFGAVLGTFGTGFLLLPSLGIRATTMLAVAMNAVIFLVSMALARGRRRIGPAGPEAPAAEQSAGGESTGAGAAPAGHRTTSVEKAVLVAFFFTGLAALSAEVIYTRVLTLVVGTTVYAFTTMLTAFLLGLALGSAVFARIAARSRRPRTLFAVVVAVIGLLVFGSSIGFGGLPAAFMHFYEGMAKTWPNLIGLQFLLSFSLLIVPTFFMGATFPLVARIYVADLRRVGGSIGTAYAFNTVGSICGSLLGSFVFLNFFGVEKGMLAVASIYLAVGVILFLTIPEKVRVPVRFAAVAAFIAILIVLAAVSPQWDAKMMTSGVYVYGSRYQNVDGLRDALRDRHSLFYDEGPSATVSVDRVQNVLAMRIDGKTDASSGRDMITQELISHIPLLLHEKPDTVLLVGLGSGVSLGSCEMHDVRHIDCVELIGSVIRAAHLFDPYCYNCQEDPRVNMIVGDGRNHVLLSSKKYDVLISQPTNPWISGVGDLFTLTYFTAARQMLKPGGIMCAWIQVYQMGDEELRTTMKTFKSVFPNATLWFSTEADVIMIGALGPLRFDKVEERMAEARIASDLGRVLIDEPEDLLGALLMDEDDLEAYIGDIEGYHTDDNMLLEFSAGRKIFEDTHLVHLKKFLNTIRARDFAGVSPGLNESVRGRMPARRKTMEGTVRRLEGDMAEAVGLYDAAFAMAPRDRYVASSYAEIHTAVGDAAMWRGDAERAASEYRKALADSISVDAWKPYTGLGAAHYEMGMNAEARMYFEKVFETNPYNGQAYFALGEMAYAEGDIPGAIENYEKSVDLTPWLADAANNLAWLYAEREENLERALDLARTATMAEKKSTYYDTLGWVYYKMGELDRARDALEEALEIDPLWVESMYHLALVHLGKGDVGTAKRLLDDVIRTDSDGYFRNLAQEKLDEL